MTEANQSPTEHLGETQAGKYLSFALSAEQYAVDIMRVVEIFGMCNITRVPRCPDHVKGVINLRGKIIPVVDLRLKFGLPERDYDSRTCIIVINTMVKETEITIGIIVDTVLEVRDFPAEDIAPAPNYGAEMDNNFITGMGKYDDGRVSILLDIDKIFDGKDRNYLVEQAAANSDNQ